MINIALDIETVPGQDADLFDTYLQRQMAIFKPPSTLTMKQALHDLNIDYKENTLGDKAKVLDHWTECFREKKSKELADKEWRKTALDGFHGEVISIAAICDQELYSDYRTLKGATTENKLVDNFFQWVRSKCTLKAHRATPFFIGHNILFDTLFLYRRSVKLQVYRGFELPFNNGIHNRHFFCNSQAVCLRGDRISQNELAKACGIELKPNDIDGSKVWDFVLRGEEKRVNEYNEYDVNTVVKIYNRLTEDRENLWHRE